MLKKFLIGTVVALALLVGVTASAADYGTVTLKVGSKGPAVVSLQILVGATADGDFGPLTKAKVMIWQQANGLTADGLFGNLSKAKANGSTTTTTTTTTTVVCPVGFTCTSTSTGALTGAEGAITVTDFTSGTETVLGEGKDEKVLGVKVEADNGSDVSLSTMKVFIDTPTDSGSTRLERYIDGVDIYMGSTKVGSADVSDFSKDGTDYTKSVALTGAVIKKGESAKFYVVVNAKSVIDSDDIAKNWDVDVTGIRFQDAMGVMTTESYTDEVAVANISFESSTDSDGISTAPSSFSPSATSLKVKDNGVSDEYLAFAFKLKADTNSSGLNVLEIPITVNPATATHADGVISDIYLKVGSKIYDNYDLPTNSDIYTFTIDEGDLALDAGDTAEVKVYATFMKEGLGSTYTTGDTVTFSLDASTVVVENTEGDSVSTALMTNRTGSVLTLSTNDVTISGSTWTINSVGSLADFTFTVNAETEDFVVTLVSVTGVDTNTGTATVATAELAQTPVESTVTVTEAGVSYTVSAGTSATFRVRYAITGNNGTIAEITIPSVAGIAVPTDKQVSPTVTRNV